MKCSCDHLSQFFEPHPDEEFNEFIDSVSLVESSEDYGLYHCECCGQYYAVEQYSRGPLIAKLNSLTEFTSFDGIPYRKLLFIESYGGMSDKKCIQAGCSEKALANLAFCVEHGFEW